MCDEEKLKVSILDTVIREYFFWEVTFEQRLNKVRESPVCNRRELDYSKPGNNQVSFVL